MSNPPHHPGHPHHHHHARRPSQEEAVLADGKKVPEPRAPIEKLNLDFAQLNKPLTSAEIVAKQKDFLVAAESVLQKTVLGPNDNEFDLPGWERSKDGGLKCINMAELERQKGVVSHLIKSFGANLVSGRSVVNVSLPVRVFEPRSFLERIPDAWAYPIYLMRAAFAPTPLERMQWVMTFMVAGLHRAVTNLKPFNPILGETFEAVFKDGTQMCLEQISHHPPISGFQMIGPNRVFHMHGHHEFAASMSANSVLGQQLGENVVEFFDGGRIVYTNPHALARGIVWGERNFTWVGTAHFRDEQNNLSSNLVFNPDEKNGLVRMFSAQKTPDDHFRGEIMYTPPEPKDRAATVSEKGDKDKDKKSKKPKQQVVALVQGSWMDGIWCGPDAEHLKAFWTKATIKPLKCVPVEKPLPSDARYREDLIFLLAGDEDESQKWKGVLEERQRHDKHLRKNYEKNRKRTVVASPMPVSQSNPRIRQSMSDISISEKDKSSTA